MGQSHRGDHWACWACLSTAHQSRWSFLDTLYQSLQNYQTCLWVVLWLQGPYMQYSPLTIWWHFWHDVSWVSYKCVKVQIPSDLEYGTATADKLHKLSELYNHTSTARLETAKQGSRIPKKPDLQTGRYQACHLVTLLATICYSRSSSSSCTTLLSFVWDLMLRYCQEIQTCNEAIDFHFQWIEHGEMSTTISLSKLHNACRVSIA